MACQNDLPQDRLWGRLDPGRSNEKAVTHDAKCIGEKGPLSCPAGFFEYENHRSGLCGLNTCYRSPDSYAYDPSSLAKCCTDGSPATQTECPPYYCPASAKCANYMRNLCSTGFADGRCRIWCLNNPGLCDAGAAEYCRFSPGDPFCACLRSPLVAQDPNAIALPSCFDGKCVAAGYKTAPMLSTHCPSVCQQALNCWQGSNGSCQIDSNQFQLNCGGMFPVPSPAPSPSPPSGRGRISLGNLPGLVDAVLDWAKSRTSTDWLVLVLILVLLAAAAVAWGAGRAESGAEATLPQTGLAVALPA